jgi:hypothetical protein
VWATISTDEQTPQIPIPQFPRSHSLVTTLKTNAECIFLAASGVFCSPTFLVKAICFLLQMEFSDGIRHAVAFNTLNIRHLVDLSPNTILFAKEIRYCVIAIVLGFATTSVVKSVLNYRRRLD